MISKPELFSAPMIRAILEGRKTQTRRIMKPQPGPMALGSGTWYPSAPPEEHHGRGKYYHYASREMFLANVAKDFCPHPVGSRIWVREVCWLWGRWEKNGTGPTGRQKWRFKEIVREVRFNKPEETAKRDGSTGWVYRHARYMPRWASRITLEVTAVKVGRVASISEEDAKAEGAPDITTPDWPTIADYHPVDAFADLWDSLYATRPGCSWAESPYVFAYTFRRVE